MIANEKNMVNYKVLDLAKLSNFHINFVFIRFYLKNEFIFSAATFPSGG